MRFVTLNTIKVNHCRRVIAFAWQLSQVQLNPVATAPGSEFLDPPQLLMEYVASGRYRSRL